MRTAIDDFLSPSASAPCLLLVHPEINRLEEAAREIISTYGLANFTIGRELSAALITEPSNRLAHAAQRYMRYLIRQAGAGPLLCTEIDLLFEPSLALDPPTIFKQAGRTTRLIVTWPGSFENEILAYAVTGHAHYRTWRNPELTIVCL
ncbi:MAG: BREX-3 system P-loop-containing protein BrxF [Chloroflexi bacterium]|nr:BREX-3 system P-loop-containing protein BrxF [Chloroflexota bacterium]